MSNSKTRKKLQIFSLEYDVLKDKPQHTTEMRRGLECQPPHKLQTAGGSRRGGSIGPHVDSSEGFRPTRSSTRTGKGINTTSSKTTPWCLNSLWRCGLHFVPRPSCSTNTPLTPRQRGEQRGRAALLPFWMDTDESEGSWGIRADVFFFFLFQFSGINLRSDISFRNTARRARYYRNKQMQEVIRRTDLIWH